jgi:hypothetical protein
MLARAGDFSQVDIKEQRARGEMDRSQKLTGLGFVVALGALSMAGFTLSRFMGCGTFKESDSDFMIKQKAKEEAIAALQEKGLVIEPRHYLQGNAVAVSLKGATIDEPVFDRLKKLGHITELDLSDSTITDQQLARINEAELGSLLLILDLSHTQIGDDGLAKLDSLHLLTVLKLTGTKVTNDGVQRFLDERQAKPNILKKFKSPEIVR